MTLRIEHKILLDLLCKRIEMPRTVGLTEENWEKIVAEAGRHRIAPLLYHKIKLAKAEAAFPVDVFRKLREQYLATAARNTLLFHQLTDFIARLQQIGIPVILLKGAHLAEFVYTDISLRPMSDIDIMVRKEDLAKAVQVAFASGYRFIYDKDNSVEKPGESYCYDILEHYKHFQPLIHPETKCLLEIHCFITEVGSPFQIPASDLWKASEHVTLNGKDVFLLSPEDLLIYLCLHVAYDHLFGFGMGALYDIALTIQHYKTRIDWQDVRCRSGKWGTDRCLFLALYYTRKWFDADIPDEIVEKFTDDEIVRIAEERIFMSNETIPLHPHYIRWRNLESLGEKMRYLVKVILPSGDFMKNRYLKPKHSRILLGDYAYRWFQALRGGYGIARALMNKEKYVAQLNQGESDFCLRQWLAGA